MGAIEWDSTLDTGEPLVDGQHRDLVALVNAIDSLGDDDIAGIVRALGELTDYASIHFATEEELMARLGYPGSLAEKHIREHRLLAGKTREMSIDYRRGWVAGTGPLVEYLGSWLTDHIDKQDRLLAEHARRHGETMPEAL